MSVTSKFYDKEVLAAMERAKSAALIKIGIAAKRNIQGVVIQKDIYESGQLHDTMDWGSDGVIGKIPTEAVDVGSPKNYAPFQELGTRFIPSRPFIRPGIMDNMDEYKDIAGQEISATMK